MFRKQRIAAACFGLLLAGSVASAGTIAYAPIGQVNPTSYTITATTTGDVYAFFAGSTAAYENQLGLLVNGVPSPNGFGLDDHATAVGTPFNLGHANAGDTLVFVLHGLTVGQDAYSDPALNVAYDYDGSVGHNHLYVAPYDGSIPPLAKMPGATFVAFEDLQFPYSDFNYNDETFLISGNVRFTPNVVPEPTALALLGIGVAGLVSRSCYRRNKTNRA